MVLEMGSGLLEGARGRIVAGCDIGPVDGEGDCGVDAVLRYPYA